MQHKIIPTFGAAMAVENRDNNKGIQRSHKERKKQQKSNKARPVYKPTSAYTCMHIPYWWGRTALRKSRKFVSETTTNTIEMKMMEK